MIKTLVFFYMPVKGKITQCLGHLSDSCHLHHLCNHLGIAFMVCFPLLNVFLKESTSTKMPLERVSVRAEGYRFNTILPTYIQTAFYKMSIVSLMV